MLKCESTSLLLSYSRIAEPADRDALTMFINKAFAKDQYPFKDRARTNIEEIAEHLETGYFLLVETEGKLAGAIYVEFRDDQRGYLAMLTVGPDHQRQGLGKRLRESAEQFCRDHGCRTVEAVVLASKSDLVAMYQREGYRISGEVPYEQPEILAEPSSLLLIEKELSSQTSSI